METFVSALVETETQFSALVGLSALVETETRFSALVGLSALVETETRFSALVGLSALVETETRFSALVGLSVLVETETRFSALVELSALVETETWFSALVEAETCFAVHLLLHFRLLGVRLTSADGARGGGGVIDSGGAGCAAVSTATYAASAVSGMGTCGDALSKTTCAASVSGKCQRRGPVSSRHPARMGCPSG